MDTVFSLSFHDCAFRSGSAHHAVDPKVTFLTGAWSAGVLQDDKALDKAWKKECAEAGEGLGQPLYQLFRKRHK